MSDADRVTLVTSDTSPYQNDTSPYHLLSIILYGVTHVLSHIQTFQRPVPVKGINQYYLIFRPLKGQYLSKVSINIIYMSDANHVHPCTSDTSPYQNDTSPYHLSLIILWRTLTAYHRAPTLIQYLSKISGLLILSKNNMW